VEGATHPKLTLKHTEHCGNESSKHIKTGLEFIFIRERIHMIVCPSLPAQFVSSSVGLLQVQSHVETR